jgi:hypothetical protein
MDTRPSGKVLRIIIALLAWLGLAIQFYYIIKSSEVNGKSVSLLIGNYFSYFTILTNLMIAVSQTVVLLRPFSSIGRFSSKISVQTAIAIYILTVGITYNVILRSLYTFSGIESVGNELLHLFVPLLYFIFWLACVPKGTLKWGNAFPWLMYPLIYLIYTLLRGPSSGFYPYPFVDVSKIGYPKTFTNSIFLFIAFLILSLVFIALDKWLGRRVAV